MVIRYSHTGLETNDPRIAAMFLGNKYKDGLRFTQMLYDPSDPYDVVFVFDDGTLSLGIGFEWPLVAEKIKPVYGEACFCWNAMYANGSSPRYDVVVDLSLPMTKVKATALTIGKTIGELRELIRWTQEQGG